MPDEMTCKISDEITSPCRRYFIFIISTASIGLVSKYLSKAMNATEINKNTRQQ